MPHSLKNGGLGDWFPNSPPDFSWKCKDFEDLNAIALHFISRSNRGRKKSTTVLSVGQEADTVPSGQCG
ncbi:MAG: hypothetical protein HEQ13_01790 [Dolichospermum sp. DEX189]|uniref:Uncharacterized protein n=1 Tax=Aphanizomenon flos-aquae FACHB-1040 TaxID=2692887 RepID=A0ABR8BUR1_APHFL|nr:hypothetical protein [Aphanizomenon flos-aquae]MBD2278679.1 hypothetical protein [Aphanizomenon flos-aquae FACHB-1040]MBO1068202.1 hypothetical protein [Dolichospermum sp. DEX189]